MLDKKREGEGSGAEEQKRKDASVLSYDKKTYARTCDD
jgi:hypothetical protein